MSGPGGEQRLFVWPKKLLHFRCALSWHGMTGWHAPQVRAVPLNVLPHVPQVSTVEAILGDDFMVNSMMNIEKNDKFSPST